VVGNLTGSDLVGSGGSHVLAIQTGMVPTTAPGTTANAGIQIYSDDDLTGTSIFHLMNGDGTVIQLYSAPAITTADNSTVSSTYGTTEADVIKNMRDRINDLEARLQALGLLH
jgi:hypothetical protein